jgi:hypothetical protein
MFEPQPGVRQHEVAAAGQAQEVVVDLDVHVPHATDEIDEELPVLEDVPRQLDADRPGVAAEVLRGKADVGGVVLAPQAAHPPPEVVRVADRGVVVADHGVRLVEPGGDVLDAQDVVAAGELVVVEPEPRADRVGLARAGVPDLRVEQQRLVLVHLEVEADGARLQARRDGRDDATPGMTRQLEEVVVEHVLAKHGLRAVLARGERRVGLDPLVRRVVDTLVGIDAVTAGERPLLADGGRDDVDAEGLATVAKVRGTGSQLAIGGPHVDSDDLLVVEPAADLLEHHLQGAGGHRHRRLAGEVRQPQPTGSDTRTPHDHASVGRSQLDLDRLGHLVDGREVRVLSTHVLQLEVIDRDDRAVERQHEQHLGAARRTGVHAGCVDVGGARRHEQVDGRIERCIVRGERIGDRLHGGGVEPDRRHRHQVANGDPDARLFARRREDVVDAAQLDLEVGERLTDRSRRTPTPQASTRARRAGRRAQSSDRPLPQPP